MNSKNKALEEIVRTELPRLVKLLEQHMDFDRWEFTQTFHGVAKEFPPSIIYDSGSCRVRFEWCKGDPRDGYDTLRIRYGRLHASNYHQLIVWNGQLSHCWHDIRLALNFLDGLTPNEAVERRNKWPTVINQFIHSRKGNTWSEIEWTARAHAFVWKHYENRLFDLFDLRRQDLWDKYVGFVREYYNINGSILGMKPPQDQIC